MIGLSTPSVTFTPGAAGAGTLNLSGIANFEIRRLVAVINLTRGAVLYAPTLASATVSGSTLTLSVDTSTHNAADTLWVKYDDPAYVAPTANFTRPANTTAYASGQIIANSTTPGLCTPIALTASRFNDAPGAVRRVRLSVNDAIWFNATVRVHLLRSSPTFAAGDGGAFSGNITESGYLGSCDVTFDRQFSDPSVVGFGVPAVGGEINFLPNSGSQTIFGVLEARSSVTPTASKTFTLSAEVYTG